MIGGAIYYTDFHVHRDIHKVCLEQLKKVYQGNIVSVSLEKPVDLGCNIVLTGEERGYPTMVKQIITGLENLESNYVFFLEHDILYHPSHFDFVPEKKDIYYYNLNNWRWLFPNDYLITYNGLTSLSMLCCDRELALKHYKYRQSIIHDFGLFEIKSKEPKWARKMGYEPGTKLKRRGGVTDEVHEKWYSASPNIDIRHRYTFSSPKVYLQNFKHPPSDWREGGFQDVPEWDLQSLFKL